MNFRILKTEMKLGFSLLLGPLKKFIFHPAQRRDLYYVWYYKHKRVKKQMILYESFYGRGLLCNPYAIFQELIQNPEYGTFQHIWVLDRLENHQELMQKYKKKYSNVKFVQFESKKYLKYLASAKYLVNNFTFSTYFIKKPEQIYVNTWHGIPLKTLGYDEPQGALVMSNTARNFFHADYMISANPFLTDIYMHAFKQGGLSEVKIIEEGYPRLDLLVHTQKDTIYKELHEAGVSVQTDKKIILYAPTWRGGYSNPDCSLDGFVNLKETLEQMIDTSAYQILVKVHQVVYSKIKETLDDFSYVIPATVDANAVLSITDIFFSDYSSIYFDFLATGKPVLFYITDLERYLKQRGMYFGLEALPGPYTDDLEILGGWICKIQEVFAKHKKHYDKVRSWSCSYEIGSITKKIVRAVFLGQTEGVHIVECKNNKKKLLISRGPVQTNGISTALINLLNQVDYEAYDVTVLVKPPIDGRQKEQIMKINPKARVLLRQGGMVAGILEEIRNNFYTQTNPVKGFGRLFFPKRAYERECRRLFGDCVFDYAIDYDGYDITFATFCLMQKNAKTGIWMHNDMTSEYQTRFHWLKRVFAIYHKFDYLVSCSRQIMEVNRKHLSAYANQEKFRYAKNCVDFARVRKGSQTGSILRKQDFCYYTLSEGGMIKSLRLIPLQPEPFDTAMGGTFDICSNQEKVKNKIVRFVNLARLSAEKNQAEMIKAFARLAQEQPNVMLYIIGQGPERKNLENLIRKLNMQDRAILTGVLSNPFGLMYQCDCFVLPSLYEGQPLTVFEARALHLPVILSDFSSVEGSLLENGQYIVHMDADSIYKGMLAYLCGKIENTYVFHDDTYNKEAYEEFKQALFMN